MAKRRRAIKGACYLNRMLIAVLVLAALVLWGLAALIPFRREILHWLDRRFGR